MTVSRVVDIPPPRVHSVEARTWFMAAVAAVMWADVLYAAARRSNDVSLPPWLTVLVGLATQLAFTACEAAVAVQVWRVAGESVRWRELAPRLLVVSSLEALATAIAAGHTSVPSTVAIWLSGVRAARAAMPASGLAFAFTAFGALTVARLWLSAHVQAGAARASFGRALVVVLTLYLATRLVMWWSFDLLQGRSFQSWR